MKTIGLIGGMSWESSLEYYRILNELARERLGGLHSAKCLMVSVDFAEIEEMQRLNRWKDAANAMVAAALSLERGGADFILLCTNTMHKLAPQIEAAVRVPFLHIADATAQRVSALGLKCVGLLGTRYTMEEEFYRGRLIKQYGLQVLIPERAERELVHRVIYDELCLGTVLESSRASYRQIISGLVNQGAEGIILGCTEIGLLVKPEDSPVPLFDTTRIHAEEAMQYAIKTH